MTDIAHQMKYDEKRTYPDKPFAAPISNHMIERVNNNSPKRTQDKFLMNLFHKLHSGYQDKSFIF